MWTLAIILQNVARLVEIILISRHVIIVVSGVERGARHDDIDEGENNDAERDRDFDRGHVCVCVSKPFLSLVSFVRKPLVLSVDLVFLFGHKRTSIEKQKEIRKTQHAKHDFF